MEEQKNPSAEEAKGEFGKHNINVAMYIVYNVEKDEYGVIGAPGFLDDKNRAYFALWMAEKQLDKFYLKKEDWRERLLAGAQTLSDKMNFRNFFAKRFKK